MPRPAPDPETASFIERYLEASGLSTASSVQQQRIDYGSMLSQFTYPHPPGISSSDSKVEGRHGDIPLRHYRFEQGNDRALIFFIHGGGFILGSLDSHDDICAELCAITSYDLVSVDYRLSPEHLHPVHLDDVEDAFVALGHENTILVGASAGGTLAAALCHRRREAEHKPAAQLLIYPSLGGDLFDLDSYRDNAEAPLLSISDVQYYRETRCASDTSPQEDAEFYPLVASGFDGIVPTITFSADIDPLRDDAGLYVEKLEACGVPARWTNEPGLVHDYLRARHVSKSAGAAFARICEATTELAQSSRTL